MIPLKLLHTFFILAFCNKFWVSKRALIHTAIVKMTDASRGAIARVFRTGDSKGIKHRKHAMLWLFQVFALTASLYGCQVWATSSQPTIPQKLLLHTSFILAFWNKFGCQKQHWCTQLAMGDRTDAYLFLLVQVHYTILEQPTFF